MSADQQPNSSGPFGSGPFSAGGSPFGAASQFRQAARVRFVQLQREQSLLKRILGTILFLILVGLGVILGLFALAVGLIVVAILAVVIGIRRLLMKITGSSNEGRSNVRVVRSPQR
ncbi:MAG: hypothetical protein ACIAQF_10815 [Phycisphaerales bacterium JB065]